MNIKYKIKGLDCANCALELEEAIEKIEGINNVSISFMGERMIIEFEDSRKDEIIEKIKNVIKKEEPEVTIIEM